MNKWDTYMITQYCLALSTENSVHLLSAEGQVVKKSELYMHVY